MKELKKVLFGQTKAGEKVYQYTLENDNGVKMEVLDYACIIRSLFVPDKCGKLTDVVLGFDDVHSYEESDTFFGAFVGRFANRILNAQFELNGVTYTLPKNDGENHLHGTFAHRVFPVEATNDTLVFRGVGADGEEGFPGKLTFSVTYTLTEDNAVSIRYLAETDKDTVINFTNHSYFNLNGQDASDIGDIDLTLHASTFTEGNEETVPTGRILPVQGTPMDFTAGKKVGKDIASEYDQIAFCHGYDHNFIIDGEALREFAVVRSEKTGITMKAYTDQPGVQLYTGNFMDNEKGKGGVVYPNHGGLCLETQHFPCSPNFPQFPSTVLRPGEKYDTTTVYQFI